MKSLLLTILLLVGGVVTAVAQTESANRSTAIIRGRISTSDGKPAEFVSVQLKGTNKGAITDENGQYRIERVKPGSYKLTVSLVGLETKEQAVEAKAGQTLDANFSLTENERQLQEVVVKSTAMIGGQVSTQPAIGLLGNRNLFETPVSTKSFTNQFILNQQANTANDILVRDASYVPNNGPISGSDGGLIRGFRSNVAESSFDGGANIMNRRMPLEMTERVDIIKGPATFYSGVRFFGGVGGTVNYESKKPLAESLTSLTTGYTTRGLFDAHVDISRRFGRSNAFGVRINAAIRGGEMSFQDVRERNRVFHIALNHTSKFTRLDVQAGTTFGRIDGTSFGFNFPAAVPVLNPPSSGRFRGPAWAFSEYDYQFTRARLEVDLTTGWTLSASVGATAHTEDFLNLNGPVINQTGRSSPTVYPQYGKSDWGDFWNADAILRGNITTGWLKQALTVGVGYQKLLESFRGVSIVSPTGVQAYNIYAVHTLDTIPTPILRDNGTYYPFFDNQGRGITVSDELAFWNNRVLITLGMRYQQVEQKAFAFAAPTVNERPLTTFNDGRFSPAFGLVVKATPSLSLYGNYLEALERGSTAPGTAANAGTNTPPGISKQIELGAKLNRQKFGTTIAVFQISRPSAFVNPDNNVFDLFGLQRNRGAEIDFFGTIETGLRALGSYAFLHARLLKNANKAVNDNFAIATPKHTLSMGLEYDPALVKGLTLTGNYRYVGQTFYTVANDKTLPAYYTIDLGLRYLYNGFEQVPIALRVKAENLLNQAYFQNTGFFVQMGNPRTLRVSLQANF